MPDSHHALSALRFRALGDETRLRLLEVMGSGERTVQELMSLMGLGQSLVSHHLRALREAGLVSTRRDGKWIHYSLARPVIADVRLVLYELG